jgi:hypothetical protein
MPEALGRDGALVGGGGGSEGGGLFFKNYLVTFMVSLYSSWIPWVYWVNLCVWCCLQWHKCLNTVGFFTFMFVCGFIGFLGFSYVWFFFGLLKDQYSITNGQFKNLPSACGASVRSSDCGSEGIGFDPHSGQNKSEAIFSVHLNRQDCSGGSES